MATGAPAAPGATNWGPRTLESEAPGAVSLVKGERIHLEHADLPPLTEVVMGLGWAPAQPVAPAQQVQNIDLDASAIALDPHGNQVGLVYYAHLSDFHGALRHGGDNKTGSGQGIDDEQIFINLEMLAGVQSLVFTITSYRGQRFTDISHAFCHLVDAQTGRELVRFDLSNAQQPYTGVIMAMLRRSASGITWEMHAVGEFHDAKNVKKLVDVASRISLAP